MIPQILQAVGGVGLFLLGMALLTDGLRAIAGDKLRTALARFTRNPATGALTGSVTTAVIQSSSATTVAAIGLVGAGLLSFQQSLGIIFGANVGTTVTGWLVAILGFKFKIGLAALPMTLAGALIARYARGRWSRAGTSLAGFGLLFVGLDMIQAGMAGFEGDVTPDIFPGDTLPGRLLLVLIGILVTVVTQSSSAGIAMALVALHQGAISFPQGAAMVIGMNVGTTSSAILAAIGGSTAMRRTAYAHVIFNVATGVIAFLLLPAFIGGLSTYLAAGGDAQFALVGFHTLFNVFGAGIALPLTVPFARLVMRIVPERGASLVDRLDDRLLETPSAALDAAVATVRAIALETARVLAAVLQREKNDGIDPRREIDLRDALEMTRLYLERVNTGRPGSDTHRKYLSSMHAVDHLNRLLNRCTQTRRIAALRMDARMLRLSAVLRDLAWRLAINGETPEMERRFDKFRGILRGQRHIVREGTIQAAAQHELTSAQALIRLDAIRWLHRQCYHLWRITHHLLIAKGVTGALPRPEPPQIDLEED